MKPLTTENKELLDYYVLSGTYGNDSNLVSNGVKFRGNGSKFRYLMYRFFPPVSFLENSVPWVKKNKLLILAAYMYRFLHGATVNRKKVGSEFRYLGKKLDLCARKFLWVQTSVKRIIQNEAYTGTLINHKTVTSKIYKTVDVIPPEEQYRHENFMPAIIDRETFEQAQILR